MHDLIIKNGLIVDGTGTPGYRGDVAVDGDRIVAVGQVSGTARRTLDAGGQMITPGFVDIHTHYDGQVSWDSVLAPSSSPRSAPRPAPCQECPRRPPAG